ncbi:MAG: ABC transporter ATP-binding protein [Actinomycetota bacterium]|nr:ABC transporter ATP-binding protein [Actinomycetota bacterium]
MLTVDNLVTGYGKNRIVKGVTMQVGEAEIVSLIGPNGAGKSTLMKAIFGMLPVWEGSIKLSGTQINGQRPERIVAAGIAYVPQIANVFESLTIMENLQVGAYLKPRALRERAQRMFELFPDLHKKRKQKAREMSGGQRQMLAFARALMMQPVVLLLDEPTAGLAPKVAEDIMNAIKDINREGVAILIVEQNARKALDASDRGYVLATGQNRFEGTAQEILDNTEISRLYLGG